MSKANGPVAPLDGSKPGVTIASASVIQSSRDGFLRMAFRDGRLITDADGKNR